MNKFINGGGVFNNVELNILALIVKNDPTIFKLIPKINSMDWGLDVHNSRIDVCMYFTLMEHYFCNIKFIEFCNESISKNNIDKLINSVNKLITDDDLERMISPILLDINQEYYLEPLHYSSKYRSDYLSTIYSGDTSGYYHCGTRMQNRGNQYYSGTKTYFDIKVSNELIIISAMVAALEASNYHCEAENLWNVLDSDESWWNWIIDIYSIDRIQEYRQLAHKIKSIPWFDSIWEDFVKSIKTI